MTIRSFFYPVVAACLLALSTEAVHALNLPKIFSDHMVLQREKPVKIWGWADAGQSVTVSFADQKHTVKAGADGKWMATLQPMKANAAPASLVVTAGGDTVTVKDVLVGEVWVCSGQSNMEWTINATHNKDEVVAAANYPQIRQFKVPHVINTKPQTDLPGDWKVCSPGTVANFTGVGYHFGLELHKKLNVPIGLVNTSWGGTRIEPWTDPKGFEISPKLSNIAESVKNADATHQRNLGIALDRVEKWLAESRAALEAGKEITPPPANFPKHPLNNAGRPTAIYNAMVAPLVPFTMRGAIWYQGESNNGEGMLYHEKMKALISSWRRIWGQGEFPFLFVQLAPFRYKRPMDLPGIWEAQTATLSVPNTGMAVTTDISNIGDIHPRNKQEVGRRLSLWARAKTYGESDLAYSGPLFKSMTKKGGKLVLTFDHAKGLKSSDGKPLTWFTVAGADGKFHEATASVVGDTIEVASDKVATPQSVRFGWDEIAEPNLVNGAGLPASPFRSAP